LALNYTEFGIKQLNLVGKPMQRPACSSKSSWKFSTSPPVLCWIVQTLSNFQQH